MEKSGTVPKYTFDIQVGQYSDTILTVFQNILKRHLSSENGL